MTDSKQLWPPKPDQCKACGHEEMRKDIAHWPIFDMNYYVWVCKECSKMQGIDADYGQGLKAQNG